MKLRTLMLGGALALAAISGLAQADSQQTNIKPVALEYSTLHIHSSQSGRRPHTRARAKQSRAVKRASV